MGDLGGGGEGAGSGGGEIGGGLSETFESPRGTDQPELHNTNEVDVNEATNNPQANANGGNTSPIPQYENKGQHDPKSPNFNKTKSVLPDNAQQLFNESVADPADPKTRWTKVGDGKDAVYHRFQSNKDGTAPFHWNGSTNAKLKNGTSNPISLNNIPKQIKRIKKQGD